MLQTNDLNFILTKTKLPIRKLLTLIEEDRDFELVIESIACHLTEEDKKMLYKLSSKLKIKIILYNLACNKDYDINEKSYICDILISNYKQIYSSCYLPRKGQKRVINQFINAINNDKINVEKLMSTANNFNKIGYKDISSHLSDWIEIIKQSKKIVKEYNIA